MEERDGQVKVSEHWVFNRFFPYLEEGELTSWVDEEGESDSTGNGSLEPDEQDGCLYTPTM